MDRSVSLGAHNLRKLAFSVMAAALWPGLAVPTKSESFGDMDQFPFTETLGHSRSVALAAADRFSQILISASPAGLPDAHRTQPTVKNISAAMIASPIGLSCGLAPPRSIGRRPRISAICGLCRRALRCALQTIANYTQ